MEIKSLGNIVVNVGRNNNGMSSFQFEPGLVGPGTATS